jgi:hypothetical protein
MVVTFVLGVALVSFLRSKVDYLRKGQIPPQELLAEAPCFEQAQTPQGFSKFWLEFRGAVEREDKVKLFSLTRKCDFEWSPFIGPPLIRSLEVSKRHSPVQLDPALEIGRTSSSDRGGDLKFATYSDFLANYEIIFSKSNRLRFLRGEPGQNTEGEYGISWREKALNHLCFDRVEASGYKFSGLTFEP